MYIVYYISHLMHYKQYIITHFIWYIKLYLSDIAYYTIICHIIYHMLNISGCCQGLLRFGPTEAKRARSSCRLPSQSLTVNPKVANA